MVCIYCIFTYHIYDGTDIPLCTESDMKDNNFQKIEGFKHTKELGRKAGVLTEKDLHKITK